MLFSLLVILGIKEGVFLFKFFDQVISFFEMLVDFIVSLVSGLAAVISHMGEGMAYLTAAIAYMPPLVTGTLAALIGLSVVFLLVDR